MNLQIEAWLSGQHFNKNSQSLFNESIRAYKASAYKAALLFSYLGFLTVLKERIIRSPIPPGIPQGLWTHIQRGIQNEEKWDAAVFDSTQQKDPAPVFILTDTIRRDVSYWKDRRNDCAHFKVEDIGAHHVDCFWSFLQTNLPKFVVNGGLANLMLRIERHYDQRYTTANSDITDLVREIGNILMPAELNDFFVALTDSNATLIWDADSTIFNSILENYQDHVAAAVIDYIKADARRLYFFVADYPAKIPLLNLNADQIRSLWYTQLFSDRRNHFHAYATLLNNRLIPAQDMRTAHNRVISRISQQRPEEQHIYNTLKANGFYDVWKQVLFPAAGYGFAQANQNTPAIICYLETEVVDAQIVSSLFATNSKPLPARVHAERLQAFLAGKPEIKDAILTISVEQGMDIPANLAFLQN